MVTIIALEPIYKTQPGEPLEVREDTAAALVLLGKAKYADAVPEPPQAPRRGYRRRDLHAAV